MKNIKNAFPMSLPTGGHIEKCGMTLRDYFAAQALPSLILREACLPRDAITDIAYEYADLMMKQRGTEE